MIKENKGYGALGQTSGIYLTQTFGGPTIDLVNFTVNIAVNMSSYYPSTQSDANTPNGTYTINLSVNPGTIRRIFVYLTDQGLDPLTGLGLESHANLKNDYNRSLWFSFVVNASDVYVDDTFSWNTQMTTSTDLERVSSFHAPIKQSKLELLPKPGTMSLTTKNFYITGEGLTPYNLDSISEVKIDGSGNNPVDIFVMDSNSVLVGAPVQVIPTTWDNNGTVTPMSLNKGYVGQFMIDFMGRLIYVLPQVEHSNKAMADLYLLNPMLNIDDISNLNLLRLVGHVSIMGGATDTSNLTEIVLNLRNCDR